MDNMPYYRLVKYHEELLGPYAPSLNIWQLQDLLRCEISTSAVNRGEYKLPFSEKYVSCLPFDQFARVVKPIKIEGEKHLPNWDTLFKSIKKIGLKVPLLVEEIDIKNPADPDDVPYITIEGKHREAVLSYLHQRPFKNNVRCLLVKRDNNYTQYMMGKAHPLTLKDSGIILKREKK